MRIAVFIKRTTFHEGYGGLETQNRSLCEGLAARGYDVTVFSPKRELTVTKKTENGVDYIFVPSVYRSLFSRVVKNHWYNRSFEYLAEEHAKTKFDLVISQSSAGFGIIKRKTELNLPVVVISHGTAGMEVLTRLQNIGSLKSLAILPIDLFYGTYNLFVKQKQFIQGADKIVTVSNFVKEALQNEAKMPKEKFRVINNGVDPAVFSFDKKTQEDATKILFIGQVQKSKGVDHLINLFEDSRFDKYSLDVVGGGDYLMEFKQQVLRRGLTDKIVVYGKVNDLKRLLAFYQNSVIFVFPTKRLEGFPMVLVEAMLASLPVVAFNLGGVSDAIENGKTGYLVKPGKFNDFKNKILQVLGNDSLRKNLGENALLKAQEEFSIDVMLDKYEKVIKEVLK